MSEDKLDPPVHKLWDLANLSIVPEQPSLDDDWIYKQYLDSVVYRDNQYWVSAKTKQNSVSLYDCLQTGPSLTQRLYDVLLKFRIGTYAFTADIRKAFLRVGLQEEDRNYTKFLCIKDLNDPNSELITYRFGSVLFGATSSLFLLQAALDMHLKKSNSLNKTEINNNLYVDNFQGTTSSESKLLNIYHEANSRINGSKYASPVVGLQQCQIKSTDRN
ncbi:uncharacterized protein [Procambarus clarkii]|uniref:uncharacterized protein n=1 Tax=Procambarus clarkii TaxID=6728 RepID=UPI003742A78B